MTTGSKLFDSENDIAAEDTSVMAAIAIPNNVVVKFEDDDKLRQDEDSEPSSLPEQVKSATDTMPPQPDDDPSQGESTSSVIIPKSDNDSKMNLNDHNGGDNENNENDLIPFAQNMNTESMGVYTYPFAMSHNISTSRNDPTRKLSFDDDHQSFGMATSPAQKRVQFGDAKPSDFATMASNSSESLTCQEDQNFGSPPPVGLDSIFPSSYMEEMNAFPSLHQSQYLIDDSYSKNLLGGAFIPSPHQDPETSSLSNGNVASAPLNPFTLNIHDIRAQYSGPTLHNTFSSHSSQPLINPLPSLDGHGYNEDDDSNVQREEDNNGKKSMGKTLDNLSQISAIVARNNRPKRPRTRKMARNLPLRKRHPSLSHGQSEDIITTPVNTARQSNTRNLVSRSVSTEKKRKTIYTKQLKRHRSKPQGRSKSFPRTASTSESRFKLLPKASNTSDGSTRVIQHFTPKRHTVPILSSERSLPNTVIFG